MSEDHAEIKVHEDADDFDTACAVLRSVDKKISQTKNLHRRLLLIKLRKKSLGTLDLKIKETLCKRSKKHVSKSRIKEVRKVFLEKLKKENDRSDATTSKSTSDEYEAEEVEQSQSRPLKIGGTSSSRSPKNLKKAEKIHKPKTSDKRCR